MAKFTRWRRVHRSFDILHVAAACVLKSDAFLSFDTVHDRRGVWLLGFGGYGGFQGEILTLRDKASVWLTEAGSPGDGELILDGGRFRTVKGEKQRVNAMVKINTLLLTDKYKFNRLFFK